MTDAERRAREAEGEVDPQEPTAREEESGYMFWFVVAVLVIGSVFAGKELPQEAQPRIGDFGVGHEQWHHWYQSGENGGPLMRPHRPDVLCCGGDCRPTLAQFRSGQWYALIDGQYDPVPESRIKRNVFSPNGMAHVCAPRRYSKEPIVPNCFVAPESGA